MTVERLGLRRGEPVRFRRHDRSRWQDGKVTGLSRDGGLDIADKDGATRTIALDLVLVQAAGPRARGELASRGPTAPLSLETEQHGSILKTNGARS